jgi:tRNA threonylcarbamoyladenosine biosynthesis protein TsaB
MDYILNIHTATEQAIVAICNGETVLDTLTNEDPKRHAAFLHEAIYKVLHNNDIPMTDLKAIGVTNGPGSYTGIRVGLAAAKGLCFALGIPLITYNTLEAMAISRIDEIKDNHALYCPMIDARRMEVFTALYEADMTPVEEPSAKVLADGSYEEYLRNKAIYFSGNGSKKLQNLIGDHQNARFILKEIEAKGLGKISFDKYKNHQFDSVAYAEPSYLKEFFFMQKQA